MRVRLHGTRGAYPTSSVENQTYGGNTPCIEVIDGSQRMILDAGTGILEIDFNRDYPEKRIDIFLTHLHMDHIQGLAFCKPLFTPGKEVHIWGPGGSSEPLIHRLNRFLSPPLFPIPLRDVPSKLEVHELSEESFTFGDFKVTTEFISHPGPTLGYRVQSASKTLTYIPDHEPIIGKEHLYTTDEWISGYDLALHADLLIHDSQYSKEEYPNKIGWGHSSLEMAAEFCSRTQAKRLILFHHDPAHPDTVRTQMFEDFMRDTSYSFPMELAVQGREIEI
ncbi:MBL fold metallo-hydrolase [Robiginitalea sp.]|jgi:ribonuclease BN (tRNA processing enzyme)|uniref:MBL fold metallo-hydrolase n=1 Tax=Robiginitalea sp. TaxID=1902411 RepID=UPI003C72A729